MLRENEKLRLDAHANDAKDQIRRETHEARNAYETYELTRLRVVERTYLEECGGSGSSYAAVAPAAAAPGATAKELTLKKKAKANARHNHSE